MQEIDDRLWQVNVTFTSDNDEQLKYLAGYMRNEIRMGILLTKMDKFHKAAEIYNTLLQTISNSESDEKKFWNG